MKNIKNVIKEFLKDSERTVFLAIGSELRADDAAGVLTAKELLKNALPDNFNVLIGYTAPENLTGEIKKYKPSHLIICDAAESGMKPGDISIIAVDDVDGAAFSTHMMPMNVFINYISQDNPCKSLILGIQPKTLEFGDEMSSEVRQTAVKLSETILEVLKK